MTSEISQQLTALSRSVAPTHNSTTPLPTLTHSLIHSFTHSLTRSIPCCIPSFHLLRLSGPSPLVEVMSQPDGAAATSEVQSQEEEDKKSQPAVQTASPKPAAVETRNKTEQVNHTTSHCSSQCLLVSVLDSCFSLPLVHRDVAVLFLSQRPRASVAVQGKVSHCHTALPATLSASRTGNTFTHSIIH